MDSRFILCYCLVKNPENTRPEILKAIHINDTLTCTVFMQSVKLTTLTKYQFPIKIDIDSLLEISNICDKLTSSICVLNSYKIDSSFIVHL